MEDKLIGRHEHEEFARRIDEEQARQNKRLGALEEAFKTQNKLALSVEKMAINMELMFKEQKKQGEELDELKNAPIKKWNTVVTAILSAIGGAIGTGVIAMLVNSLK